MKFLANIFTRKKKSDTDNLKERASTCKQDPQDNRIKCHELIQQESGWDLKTYQVLIGDPIQKAENLIGNLRLVNDSNKKLIDSAVTSCLLSSRLTDGKVLKIIGSGKNRIQSNKIQKSVVVISTLINHLAKNLAQMEVVKTSGEKWIPAREPFRSWIKKDSYNISSLKPHESEVMTMRVRLCKGIITQELEDALLSYHKDYLNALYTLVMGGSYNPLSQIIEEVISDSFAVKENPADEEKKGTLSDLVVEFFKSSKVNEAGAKIWFNEDAAYVLFPQAGNDLRALAKELNINVPSETKELVKELIEEKIAALPAFPSTNSFPYYQKIIITAQGVPKKPQLSLKIADHNKYLQEENKEAALIEEVKTNTKKSKTIKESLSGKNKDKAPSNSKGSEQDSASKTPKPETKECREVSILRKVIANTKAEKEAEKVVISLSEIKAFAEDAMPVVQILESKGYIASIEINPKEPAKTKITINKLLLQGDAA